MIKEDYVSFEVAKLLKEKGFNEPCRVFYKDQQAWLYEFKNAPKAYNKDKLFEPCFLAPSLYMTMKWLREEKRTSIIIEFDLTKRGYCPYVYQFDYDMDWVVKWRKNIPMKYEEAVEAALKYSLENLI